MDLFSMMGIKGPEPLAFDGELTAEETVQVEALRARQVELYRTVDSRKLIGLVNATDEDVAALQAIGEEQAALGQAIWERADPGEARRKAHFEQEMIRVREDMNNLNKGEPESCEDAECEIHGARVEDEKISLLSRIKRFFA